MLDKQDIVVIKQLLEDSSRDSRDFTRQELMASEKRARIAIREDIKADNHEEIVAAEKRIFVGLSEIIDESISPKLDNHEHRIDKLEKLTLQPNI